jgi:hypothetical protein
VSHESPPDCFKQNKFPLIAHRLQIKTTLDSLALGAMEDVLQVLPTLQIAQRFILVSLNFQFIFSFFFLGSQFVGVNFNSGVLLGFGEQGPDFGTDQGLWVLGLQEGTILMLLYVIIDKFYQAMLAGNVKVVRLNESFEVCLWHAHNETVLVLEDLVKFAHDYSFTGSLQPSIFKFNCILVKVGHILIA